MLFSAFTALLVALPFTLATNCNSNQFWYNNKSCCVSNNGHSSPSAGKPPSGTTCPQTGANWYWHTGKQCCIPSSPNHNDRPDCPSGYNWNQGASTCVKVPTAPSKPPTSCKSNEFWWPSKSCCLPHGGPPTPTPPPSGSNCPSNWSWDHGHGCCAPHHPPGGSPTCPPKWNWCSQIFQCQPNPPPSPPQPSGRSHPRRALHKSRSAPLCAKNLTACPIMTSKGLATDMECLDLANELTSCGGCSSEGKGQDCTKIENARSVECASSKCAVRSCKVGFKPSSDGTKCISELTIAGRGL